MLLNTPESTFTKPLEILSTFQSNEVIQEITVHHPRRASPQCIAARHQMAPGVRCLRCCLLTAASGGGSSLTWVLLALLEGFEDVDEGEVVSRRVLELHEAPAGRICSQARRGSPETAGC